MHIFIHNKDILDVTEANTLVLPIDGSAPNLEGNIARHAMKRFGIEKLHQMIAPPPGYPLNGQPVWSDIEGLFNTHFTQVCLVDTFSHAEGVDHRAHLRRALNLLFRDMKYLSTSEHGVPVCPIFTGGKRVPVVDAVYILLEEAGKWDIDWKDFHIATTDPEQFDILRSIVR